MSDTVSALNAAQNLDDLYKVFAANRYTAGWHKARPSLWREPRSEFTPQHWRYRDAARALERAGEWIGTELAERRNLLMFNPVGDNDYATVRTLVAAYQMIKPGEHARAHRHTPNALRLVLDARPGLYTVVDGIRLPMNPGDVLLTPNWCWHSHYNEGKHSAVWLDFLDVPLVQLLEPMFFEEYPGGYQEVTSEPNESPFWYGIDRVRAQLRKAPAENGVRRVTLPSREHIPTMALGFLQMPGGASLKVERSTASRILAAVEGAGTTKSGALDFRWERGDVFAVPSWTACAIEASQDALLFEVSDEPVLQALNFLRGGANSRSASRAQSATLSANQT